MLKKQNQKKKNSKLFNGFKLGMLYNTTVTAYTHKSFLFRVKKKVTLEEINGDMKHTHIMHADRRPPSIHPQSMERNNTRIYHSAAATCSHRERVRAMGELGLIVMFGIALVRLLSNTFPRSTHAQRARKPTHNKTHSNATRNCVCVYVRQFDLGVNSTSPATEI